MREIRLIADTLEHRYQWSQYVDSVYNRLEIRFLEADNLPKLKFRRVMLWDITLFKPYTAPSQVNRLQANLPQCLPRFPHPPLFQYTGGNKHTAIKLQTMNLPQFSPSVHHFPS